MTRQRVATKRTRRPRVSARPPKTSWPTTLAARAAVPSAAACDGVCPYWTARTFLARPMTKRSYASDRNPTPAMRVRKGADREGRAGDAAGAAGAMSTTQART
jgi:hypothetical protein